MLKILYIPLEVEGFNVLRNPMTYQNGRTLRPIHCNKTGKQFTYYHLKRLKKQCTNLYKTRTSNKDTLNDYKGNENMNIQLIPFTLLPGGGKVFE